jgi:hypothetical protein
MKEGKDEIAGWLIRKIKKMELEWKGGKATSNKPVLKLNAIE